MLAVFVCFTPVGVDINIETGQPQCPVFIASPLHFRHRRGKMLYGMRSSINGHLKVSNIGGIKRARLVLFLKGRSLDEPLCASRAWVRQVTNIKIDCLTPTAGCLDPLSLPMTPIPTRHRGHVVTTLQADWLDIKKRLYTTWRRSVLEKGTTLVALHIENVQFVRLCGKAGSYTVDHHCNSDGTCSLRSGNGNLGLTLRSFLSQQVFLS